ncbi:type 2 isopentenyl-diphosphate Delta-isomerase [Streptomyces sp. NA04227]|uniref:type 2 isopentenyl-diphosphate Delta-isomerase n=1 Tax=Streptomyces sp. NA04227 TaxID=2742136 RepID=UPI001162F5EF|nr:type 2 isopentenyl-diphosphate Delta-isomerase [Streptomyces sp. NA04227]QDJ94220.1 SpzK [Streptomyces sp.]QKW08103.1 type 2 isopentenyl-diphosphate Delta-isomerase [Streptomyces sp. NA04227]
MIAERKDDHVRLTVEQQRRLSGQNEFDDVRFVHHALAGIDRDDVSLATSFAGIDWQAPIYINAMTGGSVNTGVINRDLAIAARETGVAIATGSVSAFFKDPSSAETFSVMRREYPGGFIMGNVNLNATADQARKAVELLEANALQIHLNTIQETAMPEGDREFSHWQSRIEEIVTALDVPVIVKEVGFGLSRETIATLQKLGVHVADVGGRGGTNFAQVENDRRDVADFGYLNDWGLSTAACLLDAQDAGIPVLASGGVRNPLDVARSLALGASAVGASGGFLRSLMDGGVDALVKHINTWLDHLSAIMTALGARTPAELAHCDVLIKGELRDFCADRGIETGPLSRRSTRLAATEQTTGSAR